MNAKRERDMLDDLTDEEAETDPRAHDDWEAMKIVARLAKVRRDRGQSQADVAARMGIAQQHVARIENRPWGVGFGRIVAYARAVGVEVGIVGDLAQVA